MEVDFNFDSASSSPYITAPSSPQPFGNYFFHHCLNDIASSSSTYNNHHNDDDPEFDFNFSEPSGNNTPLTTADELFDGGKIRPLQSSKMFVYDYEDNNTSETRGRKKSSGSGSGSTRRESVSLPPLRILDIVADLHEEGEEEIIIEKNEPKSYILRSVILFSKGYKKWKLKDLLLFRSKSEGREPADAKNASFRSSECGDVGSVSRRKGGPVSAHELHYTMNRAVSQEMKKKTFLPYKHHGFFGCFDISSSRVSVGSLPRGAV